MKRPGIVAVFDLLNLAGIAVTCVLTASKLLSVDLPCGRFSCGDYLHGSLSSLGPVPIAMLGMAAWLLLYVGWVKEALPAKTIVWGYRIFLAFCLALLAYGIVTYRTLCPWCAGHFILAASAVAIAPRAVSRGAPKWSTRALGVGIAMAVGGYYGFSGEARVAYRLLDASVVRTLDRSLLISEDVPRIQGSGDRSIIAFVDVSCGHCNRWLSQCLEVKEPKATLYLHFATLSKDQDRIAENKEAHKLIADGGFWTYFIKRHTHGLGESHARALEARHSGLNPDNSVARTARLFHDAGVEITPSLILIEDKEAKPISPDEALRLIR